MKNVCHKYTLKSMLLYNKINVSVLKDTTSSHLYGNIDHHFLFSQFLQLKFANNGAFFDLCREQLLLIISDRTNKLYSTFAM